MVKPSPDERRPRWLARTAGVGLAIGLAATAPARAADPVDAAGPPAAGAHLPGKMVFAALVTPDLVAAERFYTNLFRWQFQNAYVGRMLVGEATLDGRVVSAIVQRPMQDGQRPAWRTFLSSADVDNSVVTAVQQGAKVLVPPHDLAAIGRDALLTDPQGAVFGIMATASGDPPDVLPAPGGWIWSSLLTTDPKTDAGFYKAVFGFDTFDTAAPGDPAHVILASGTFARASVNPLPGDHPNAHPRWISYVRVADIQAAVASATGLGARVVVPAHEDRNGGTIAVLADPAGALFGLLAWSDDQVTPDAGAGDAK